MARPKTKDELLRQIPQAHDALTTYLATLTPEQMTTPHTIGTWAIKDVLTHLTAWEQMFLGWYRAGQAGQQPRTPADDLTWQQLPELNQRLYEQHRAKPLADVLAQFAASYTEVREAVSAMTPEELFTPNVYAWTRTTTLGAYAISATCSHYEWALKEIRRAVKAMRPV